MTLKTTVSGLVAQSVAKHVSHAFALMGNGNAWFLDALAKTQVEVTAVRHEAGTVVAADAYHRVSGKLAVATTTYGPGFTNAITPLAEAAQARTPLVLVTGDAPTPGPRAWDVDQAAIAAAVGVPTFTVDASSAGKVTVEAIHHALAHRTPVVLAIPYDLAPQAVESEAIPDLPALPAPLAPEPEAVARAAAVLTSARRPLVLAGRGAKAAAAELHGLVGKLRALTASTAPARGLFAGQPWDLGGAGGFASEASGSLIKQADAVLVVGAGLNQFTTAFGHAFAPDAAIIQVDIAEARTNPLVTDFVRGDALLAVKALAEALGEPVSSREPWQGTVSEAKNSRHHFDREPGEVAAPDGRLDPRSAMRQLNDILPTNRVVASDGGHFIGWANTYFDLHAADSITLVGTAYQSIGLGLPSAVGAAVARPDATVVAVTGDGGGLMALPDLDSLIRTARSAVVLVFNDAAYGAEVHQYGSQGLDQEIMRINQVDFALAGASFGAQSAVIQTLDDLAAVQAWVDGGASGTFVADLRVSGGVVAPYILEIIEATLKKQ